LRLRTLRDLDVLERRVLLRVDFNVPMEERRIVDDSRIVAALPTLRWLLEARSAVVLATHLGRPKGQVVESLRVAPLARRLGELLGLEVAVAQGVSGELVVTAAQALRPGDLLMLENVRFDPREEANDRGFAQELAALADVYVNDAFGTAHRAHASTEGVGHLLPSAAGLLMAREYEFLSRVLAEPEPPLVAIVGGAKISTKIGVIKNLLPRVEYLLVGGAMACTLLKARGLDVGASKVEDDQLATARELLAAAGDKVVLPEDAVVAEAMTADAPHHVVAIGEIPAGAMMLDIGPATVHAFGDRLGSAGTVVWNGPLGVYELPPYRAGTEGVARRLADCGAVSIVGGGDLAAALAELGLTGQITHVSTGGGATLEFLEGKELPGIKVLMTEDGA